MRVPDSDFCCDYLSVGTSTKVSSKIYTEGAYKIGVMLLLLAFM